MGYNRAERTIDQLEAARIIGQFQGSKARDVLFANEYSLGVYLEALRSGKMPEIHREPAVSVVQQEAEKLAVPVVEILPFTAHRPETSQPEAPRKRLFLKGYLSIKSSFTRRRPN